MLMSRVAVYEVGNEPDINGVSPEEYVPRLIECARGIRTIDFTTPISTAGLFMYLRHTTGQFGQPDVSVYVRRLYELGARGAFDAIAFHPYRCPTVGSAPEWDGWHNLFTHSDSVRAIMDANGDSGKPIWTSENGENTVWSSEAQQANVVDCTFDTLTSLPNAAVTWYLQRDPGGHSTYGLLRADFSRRPAFARYQARAP